MKGYISESGKCYVFPQTAAEIPAVEATSFYVQEEDFVEWVAENESIADKLVKYNYNVMTVQPKEWANHENDDLDSEILYSITLTGDDYTHFTLSSATAKSQSTVTITPEGVEYYYPTYDMTASAGQISWDSYYTRWNLTMPAEDVTITVAKAEPVSPELAWSADSATVTIGADDNVFPTLTNPNSVTVTYTSSDTEAATIGENSGEITLVAAGSTTISAIFAGNETYEAQTVTYTLTVQEYVQEYDYTMYATDDPSDTTTIDTGTFTSDQSVDRTQDIDGTDVDFVKCKITSSSASPQLVGEFRWIKAEDMGNVMTSTRCQLYIDNNDTLEAAQGYVTIDIHIPE